MTLLYGAADGGPRLERRLAGAQARAVHVQPHAVGVAR